MLTPPVNARESGYTIEPLADLTFVSGSNESIIFENVKTFSPPTKNRALSIPILLDNSFGNENPT